MEQKVRELLDELLKNRGIRPEDIPNIELYMDQVTTFMDEHLSGYKRYPEDKVLTKTMITQKIDQYNHEKIKLENQVLSSAYACGQAL